LRKFRRKNHCGAVHEERTGRDSFGPPPPPPSPRSTVGTATVSNYDTVLLVQSPSAAPGDTVVRTIKSSGTRVTFGAIELFCVCNFKSVLIKQNSPDHTRNTFRFFSRVRPREFETVYSTYIFTDRRFYHVFPRTDHRNTEKFYNALRTRIGILAHESPPFNSYTIQYLYREL